MKTKHMKPKGAKGRAAVKRLGRTYKTGGFKKIATKAAAKYGSKEAGKRVAAAIYWKKVHGSKKKGGKINKTGLYQLHGGERVLNKKQTEKFEKKDSPKEERKETPKERLKEMRQMKKGSMKHPTRKMAAKAAAKLFS